MGATGRELGLQEGLETVERDTAAVTGGGEQGFQVGVAVVAHGLAVQSQAAGDLAERVADGDHAVDLHVPVKDALDDQRRGRAGICTG